MNFRKKLLATQHYSNNIFKSKFLLFKIIIRRIKNLISMQHTQKVILINLIFFLY